MRLHHVRVLGPGGLSMPQTMEVNAEGAEDRDATGLVLSPGWMDLHAHLRDPGFPQKETLLSGATSAAVGDMCPDSARFRSPVGCLLARSR